MEGFSTWINKFTELRGHTREPHLGRVVIGSRGEAVQ